VKGQIFGGEQISYMLFRNADAEIGIRRLVRCKSKEEWQKIGLCMIKYKEKWERMVRKSENELEISLDE
jgi:hypothetical protein